MDEELVFRALADGTRRHLLDQLFEREGRTLTDLEQGLAMTRFGVMKHLRLLERAGLVTTRRAGREKLHYLNPVPIQLMQDRWISKYTAGRIEALVTLKAALEGEPMSASIEGVPSPLVYRPKQVYVTFIKASPERVWDAITRPEFTSKYFHETHVTSTLEVGAPYLFMHGDGVSVLVEGEVLESQRPYRLVHTWRVLWDDELAKDPPSRVTWELEEAGPGVTKLTTIHDGFESETGTFQSVAGGWSWVLCGLKSLLETGEPLTPPAA